MVVGINYNTDGSRYIARISYNALRSKEADKRLADKCSTLCDEMYIIDIDNTHVDFINEIVTKGCRIM